jgi:hypothetical protein
MKGCLFAGPTLATSTIEVDSINLTLYGPAKLGSVYKAVEAGFTCIGIVDGYFGNIAPVWHKEILWALSRGVLVAGAASIGALRAAELSRYGMIGVGLAYRLFAQGVLTDDDEVCVVHAPKEFGYQQLSMPLLNIRVTLRWMRRKGLISLERERILACVAKRLHFSNRTFDKILAASDSVSRGDAQQLRSDFMKTYVDVKAEDCAKLVSVLCGADRIRVERPCWTFPATGFWRTQFISKLSDLPELDAY